MDFILICFAVIWIKNCQNSRLSHLDQVKILNYAGRTKAAQNKQRSGNSQPRDTKRRW